MKIKIDKSNKIPIEFQGLGNIILKSEIMKKLNILPGDFVKITKEYNGEDVGVKKICKIFKVSIPFDSGLDFKGASTLIEENTNIGYFGELGEFDIEKLDVLESEILKEVYIENLEGEKIDLSMLNKIKEYLLLRKVPVNPGNSFLIENQCFVFSQINKSGLINNFTSVICFKTWLEKRIREFQTLINDKKVREEEESKKIITLQNSIANIIENNDDEMVKNKKEELSRLEEDIEKKKIELKKLDKEIYNLKLEKLKLESYLPSTEIEEI